MSSHGSSLVGSSCLAMTSSGSCCTLTAYTHLQDPHIVSSAICIALSVVITSRASRASSKNPVFHGLKSSQRTMCSAKTSDLGIVETNWASLSQSVIVRQHCTVMMSPSESYPAGLPPTPGNVPTPSRTRPADVLSLWRFLELGLEL